MQGDIKDGYSRQNGKGKDVGEGVLKEARNMKAAISSETPVPVCKTKYYHNANDHNKNNGYLTNLKSCIKYCCVIANCKSEGSD
jgi:hypothetical protein